MLRAIELARLGTGSVSPNPLVGCVIVHDGKIIGEGWHKKYGEAHAEVNAVESVSNKALLKEATLYVNLEPCSHQGKTPPCAEMITRHQIRKVVIANVDTNPKVSGSGIKKLRDAGVEVISGVLQREGRDLNRRFFTFVEKQRSYIILKWAETDDGFIAHENYESKWISNDNSRQLVHRWRTEEDAVLVGTRTALHDNPQLNVREWTGRNPTRVFIDRFLRLDEKLNLFDRSQPTLCYNLLKHEEHHNLKLIRLDEGTFWEDMIHDLYMRNIQSVIVEGGGLTLQTFIDGGWWDEARIFRSHHTFGKGIKGPLIRGKLISEDKIKDDQLSIYEKEPALHK